MHIVLEKIDLNKLIKYILIYTFYKIMLELAYIIGVSYWYGYMGFLYILNLCKMVVSYLILVALVVVIPKDATKYGTLINFYFSICIIPMLSFYWLANRMTVYVLLVITFFVVMVCSSRVQIPYQMILNGENYRYEFVINFIFIIYVFVCIFMGVKRGGVDSRALSFESIYSLRGEAYSQTALEGYLINWCTKALFPTLSIYFVYTKKYTKTIICFVLQIFLYLCYGYKAYLLSAFFGIGLYILEKICWNFKKKTNLIPTMTFIVLLIPSYFSRMQNIIGKISFKINNVYAMRMLFEPARIEYGYFDFFSSEKKLFFSEGLIGKAFDLNYPYDRPIGFVITNFLNGEDAVSNANTGILADSYAELGILGILLIAILSGIMIGLIEKITYDLPIYVVIGILAYPIVMLNDNPLLTNLLTNGWLIDIFMLLLIEGAVKKNNKYIIGK